MIAPNIWVILTCDGEKDEIRETIEKINKEENIHVDNFILVASNSKQYERAQAAVTSVGSNAEIIKVRKMNYMNSMIKGAQRVMTYSTGAIIMNVVAGHYKIPGPCSMDTLKDAVEVARKGFSVAIISTGNTEYPISVLKAEAVMDYLGENGHKKTYRHFTKIIKRLFKAISDSKTSASTLIGE